jgi:hypothetical protein
MNVSAARRIKRGRGQKPADFWKSLPEVDAHPKRKRSVSNAPLLARKKKALWTDSVPERSSPKRQNLLPRSRCSLCFRCRRSFRCFTCFSTRFTSCSTRFYTRATTRLLLWGRGWGCGPGSGSLGRAWRRCRVSSKNAGISDKAEDRS